MGIASFPQPEGRPDPASPRTLADLYGARLRRAPQAEACRHFDAGSQTWRSLSWAELAASAQAYAAGLRAAGLVAGDRVAIQLPNGPDWLAIDWAAHSLGLVTVGLFADETPAGTAQLLEDCGAAIWFARELRDGAAGAGGAQLPELKVLVPMQTGPATTDPRVRPVEEFLRPGDALSESPAATEALATIVYTSGATGRPKGVMLSHHNLLSNLAAIGEALAFRPDDLLYSLLPMPHLYGRVACVYAAIAAGAALVFARGAGHLAEDLASQRPTVLVGVPRVYERIHGALLGELETGTAVRRALFRLVVGAGGSAQRKDVRRLKVRLLPTSLTRRAGEALRQHLGGRLRLAISGGAALAPQIGRTFTVLGVPLLQGYGLTEAGPVVSVNRVDDNDPASAGLPLSGVETRIEASGELQVRGPSVMMGYWKDQAGTRAVLDDDGWLSTGDKVSRLDTDRIYLVGRLKELIVTATGEKASPADIESRLSALPLVEQVMVVGEARPFLTALILPQPGPLALLRAEIGLSNGDDSEAAQRAIEAALLLRCQEALRDAPRTHWIHGVAVIHQPWTVQSGTLTATQKLRRREIARVHAADLERLYRGHYSVAATDCSNNAVL